MVLLSGEPGIGKSRLVQELKEHVSAEGATRIEFRCSPYHQNTALYPITEHLQRLLQFQAAETPQTKLAKLAQLLSQYRFPQAETLPLLAALFSLPPPAGVPPLSFSPQKQKQLTLEALVAWLLEEAETRGGLLRLGRSALGRPVHPRNSHPVPGPSADHPGVGALDLSARVHPALGQSLAPQPADAEPLRATSTSRPWSRK